MKRFVLLFAAGLLLILSGCARPLPPYARSIDARIVYSEIRTQHMTTDATDDELSYGAIRGMVQALHDPFSVFLDPKAAKLERDAMAGNFVGIGIKMDQKNGRPMVAALMRGYPAEKAGLLPGDVILAIDGSKTEGQDDETITEHIRGKVGTTVRLTISRKDVAAPLDISIVRERIAVPSVAWVRVRTNGRQLLHITITEFGDDTAALFAKAVAIAQADNVEGIILDLRGDPGGSIPAAGFVICHWATHVPYVMLVNRHGDKDVKRCANTTAQFADMPTVVLVNKDSASASEITAGALQDYGRARVIGEQTFGKGCGQNITDFTDGSQLRLVSFLWYTPKGRTIHKVGIAPDEVVTNDPNKKGADAQLERAEAYLTTGK